MEIWKDKIAVVTGASSGIGASICENLVEYGLTVIGMARRVEKIHDMASQLTGKPGKLIGYKCDISCPEQISDAFDWVKKNYGLTDILINNAGVLKIGSLLDGVPNEWQTILNTNVQGPATCFKHAVAHMIESGAAGYIINLNSIVGHFVVPGNPGRFSIYCASKHAVTCLNECMVRELHSLNSKIRVTSLSPGLVGTELLGKRGSDSVLNIAKLPHLRPQDISDVVITLLTTKPYVHIRELTVTAVGDSIENY